MKAAANLAMVLAGPVLVLAYGVSESHRTGSWAPIVITIPLAVWCFVRVADATDALNR